MNYFWKNPQFLGVCAHYAVKVLSLSFRTCVKVHPSISPDATYLFAFWHGRQLIPGLLIPKTHNAPICTLVSPSKDGAILAAHLERQNFEVIRGSSRDQGARALVMIKKRVVNGVSVGTAIDGPIGPIYEPKPGLIYLSQKLSIPIVPIGSASSRHWLFNKAWDKFEIPKPCAKVGMVLGEPIYVDKDKNTTDACAEVAQCITQADNEAKILVGV